MTRFRILGVALALLLSANAWADLKTYDVDPQYRQEIYSVLKEILAPQVGQPTNGRVELLPSGQILVNASPETLEQVDQVLQTIRNRPAAPTPRAELSYWAVLGSRASVANPPGTAPPAALNDVLDELRRLHGDLQFRVIGSAALATESGQQGRVSGMALEVEQTVYVQGNSLNAEIEMNLEGSARAQPAPNLPPIGVGFHIGSVSVRTALRRDEFVVLGQSELVGAGADGVVLSQSALGADGPVFFIVHWPEAPAR
jgi:hypothetical protein